PDRPSGAREGPPRRRSSRAARSRPSAQPWHSLPVDLLPAARALADAHLDALALDLLELHPDARRQVAHGADDHQVRDVERCGLLDNSTRLDLRPTHAARVLDRARLRVPLD